MHRRAASTWRQRSNSGYSMTNADFGVITVNALNIGNSKATATVTQDTITLGNSTTPSIPNLTINAAIQHRYCHHGRYPWRYGVALTLSSNAGSIATTTDVASVAFTANSVAPNTGNVTINNATTAEALFNQSP